ncbi:hypothetical protein KI387_033498, partial [Taxus chinensis]
VAFIPMHPRAIRLAWSAMVAGIRKDSNAQRGITNPKAKEVVVNRPKLALLKPNLVTWLYSIDADFVIEPIENFLGQFAFKRNKKWENMSDHDSGHLLVTSAVWSITMTQANDHSRAGSNFKVYGVCIYLTMQHIDGSRGRSDSTFGEAYEGEVNMGEEESHYESFGHGYLLDNIYCCFSKYGIGHGIVHLLFGNCLHSIHTLSKKKAQ